MLLRMSMISFSSRAKMMMVSLKTHYYVNYLQMFDKFTLNKLNKFCVNKSLKSLKHRALAVTKLSKPENQDGRVVGIC